MKMKIHFLLLLLLICNFATAQLSPWPDAVVRYRQGPNATPGFDSTNSHFPNNVLGRPDSMASGIAPSSIPEELQSLGTGGEIIFRYTGRAIVDLPGPDFTVFENPFFVGGDSNNVFRETGVVSVSTDGIIFRQFPYSGNPAWHNLAGVTPTLGGNPLDPLVSGGDKFDLAEIDMDSIHFVRIVDAGDLISDDGPSFDLDAVAALHLVSVVTSASPVSTNAASQIKLNQNYPNPFNPTTTIGYELQSSGEVQLGVFDLLGRRLIQLVGEHQATGRHVATFDASGLPSGVLYYRLTATGATITRQMLLLR